MPVQTFATPASLYAEQVADLSAGGTGYFGAEVVVGGITWKWSGKYYAEAAPGSLTNPFPTTDARNVWAAANLASLLPGRTTVWGPGNVEYVWSGPLARDWGRSPVGQYPVYIPDENLIRSAAAQAVADGGGRVLLPVGRIMLTSPLPLGNGLMYVGSPSTGIDSSTASYSLNGTVLVCDEFNAFEFNAVDSETPNTLNSQVGMDWKGGGVVDVGIEGADYGIKVGAKWVLGISGLQIDRVWTLNCNYGVWVENCVNPIIGFISPNKTKKIGFVIASSSNGWNYGNAVISHISGNGHATEQLPGYPGVMLLSRGGNSHINDVNFLHVNYAFNRGDNEGSATASVVSGDSEIDISTLVEKVGVNHPVFFESSIGGIVAKRAYFVLSVSGSKITISDSWGGSAIIPNATGSVTVKTHGNIGFAAVGIEGSSYTYSGCELTDMEACAIGVYSQQGKGGYFKIGTFDANDATGIISFVGRATNTISGAVTVSFTQKVKSSDIGDNGLFIANGPLPETQLNPNHGFICGAVDFSANQPVLEEFWNVPKTTFPSSPKNGQRIKMAASLSPIGEVECICTASGWKPVPGALIAAGKGATNQPLAQLDSGALTSLPVFESGLFEDYLIPDGIELDISAVVDVISSTGVGGCLIGAVITSVAQPLAMNSGVFALYTNLTPPVAGQLCWPENVKARIRRSGNTWVGGNGAAVAANSLTTRFSNTISQFSANKNRFVLQATRTSANDIIRLMSYQVMVAIP